MISPFCRYLVLGAIVLNSNAEFMSQSESAPKQIESGSFARPEHHWLQKPTSNMDSNSKVSRTNRARLNSTLAVSIGNDSITLGES